MAAGLITLTLYSTAVIEGLFLFSFCKTNVLLHQTKLFYAFMLGLAFQIVTHFYISSVYGLFQPTSYLNVIAHMFLTGFLIIRWKPLKTELLSSLSILWRQKTVIILLGLFGVLYWLQMSSHLLFPENGSWYTGPSCYGDLPMHMGTISQLVNAGIFPPENHLMSGLPLVYPYLIDMHSADLVVFGLSERWALVLPGMLLGLSLVVFVYDFTRVLTHSNAAGFLSAFIFHFHGGIGFIYFLMIEKGNFFHKLLSPFGLKNYSHFAEWNIGWASFFSQMIVPERSLLLGLPIGILTLQILFLRQKFQYKWSELAIVGALWGMMPLFHTHTTLVFVTIIPILMVFYYFKSGTDKPKILKSFVLLVGFTVLVASPLMSLFFKHLNDSEGFFKVHWGWLKGDDENFFWYWTKNTSLYMPLALAFFLFRGREYLEAKIVLICGFVLWGIVNAFQIQPYHWDNIKLLIWAALFWSAAISYVLVFLWSKYRFAFRPLVVTMFACLVASGSLSYLSEAATKYPIYNSEGLATASWIKSNTPKDAIFLTPPDRQSIITNLAGRRIVLGHAGDLWVHGINYHKREIDRNAMYLGGEHALELLQLYNVSYIVVPWNIRSGFGDLAMNAEFLNAFPTVFHNSDLRILKVDIPSQQISSRLPTAEESVGH